MLNKGFILENRYKIVNVAGKGGTSIVYRAVDLKANNAQRAVKEVMKSNGTDAYNARQESLLIKKFFEKDVKNSFFPNIIEIIDNNPDALYIVQDYIDGVSMEKLLAYDPFRHKTVLRYAKDICSVMSFIHKCGMIHSDMKPDNIMVVRNYDDFENSKRPDKYDTLKFIDFGSVIERRQGTFAYTPAYAAPEQFNKEELDERTDIFNIGATLYHMMTGKKPRNVSSKGKLVSSQERFAFGKGMNASLVRIIKKCVNEDRDKRYQTCEELYDALDKAENHTYARASVLFAVLAAVFIAFSSFAGNMAEKRRVASLKELIEEAENANDDDEKLEKFQEVIKADASYGNAYLEIIKIYKHDRKFDNEENAQLVRLVNSNINELETSPEYEKVCFQIGILYWFYYNYGSEEGQDSSTVGKTKSVKWFENAQTERFKKSDPSDYEVARVYHDIGNFYVISQQKEFELVKGDYANELWDNINELNDLAGKSEAGPEKLVLETYKAILNLENSNINYFAKAGISYEKQRALVNDIRNKADAYNAEDEAYAEIKDYILKYSERILESIDGSQ